MLTQREVMLDDLDAARKNRERVAELQRKEATGEKIEPLSHRQSPPKVPIVKMAVKESPLVIAQDTKVANKTKPTPLEDYEPGITRNQFFDVLKKVTKPVKAVESGTPSMRLNFALGLLRDDNIKAFTKDYESRSEQYGKAGKFDAYMETWIERNDLVSLSKMLRHWIKYLEVLPSCQHTRGAIMVLHTLDGLCLFVEGMRPSEAESNIEYEYTRTGKKN